MPEIYHLSFFGVSGFKKFDKLEIDDIGEFNLIVGDNNSGKTTLLEALLANSDLDKFLSSLEDILKFQRKFDNLKESYLSFFFLNSLNTNLQKIKFLLVNKDKYFEEIQLTRRNESEYWMEFSRNQPIVDDYAGSRLLHSTYGHHSFNFNIPFVPFGTLYTHELTKQYSNNIQLFDDKKENLLTSLKHIIPNIKNIEVSASYSNDPIILISEKGKNRLSPLGSYGDGTVKLFRILLSLYANENYHRLMIDEIDAGVHHSRLKEFFKSLLKVASDQQKQIFATTHSKECIENFKEALKEIGFEDKGRIIRLADTKNGVKAYSMKFDEFENALKADSEIR